MSAIDSGGSVRTVFIDYKKVLDLVNHNILFRKLSKYNIPYYLHVYCIGMVPIPIKSIPKSPRKHVDLVFENT